MYTYISSIKKPCFCRYFGPSSVFNVGTLLSFNSEAEFVLNASLLLSFPTLFDLVPTYDCLGSCLLICLLKGKVRGCVVIRGMVDYCNPYKYGVMGCAVRQTFIFNSGISRKHARWGMLLISLLIETMPMKLKDRDYREDDPLDEVGAISCSSSRCLYSTSHGGCNDPKSIMKHGFLHTLRRTSRQGPTLEMQMVQTRRAANLLGQYHTKHVFNTYHPRPASHRRNSLGFILIALP